MKRRITAVFAALVSLTLWGCTPTPPPPPSRIVTAIDIRCTGPDTVVQRHYTQPEKMQNILLYLRILKPGDKPKWDPELFPHPVFQITLHLSDGKCKVYQQVGHRYLCVNGGAWRTVDPHHGTHLYTLLLQSSDGESRLSGGIFCDSPSPFSSSL